MNVICIAGMHRSGTSMITRMLNLCGLYLGEEQDLMAPHPDNPEGYWENRRFVEINDAVLSFFGGSWHIPPDPVSLFRLQHDLSFLEKQAQNVIGGFADKAFWGWKDPRSSLTLPFWQRLLPELKVIICLRNPVEVVQSLAHRDHFSEIFGFNLWQTYNQRLITSVVPADRLITHYNMYFEDPETELRRLLEFMNIKVDNSTIRSACQTTLSSLKRNRATFGNLIETGTPLEVVNLYAEMCSQAGQHYLNIINKTDIQLSSNNIEYFDREIEQDLLSKFMEKDPLVQSMTQWVARKQRQIELLDEQLVEKEQSHTAQVQALTAERDAQVQALTTERDAQVQNLLAQIVQKEQEIAEIRRSRVWKLALLFRQIRVVLAPPNSWRATVLRQLIKMIIFPFRIVKKKPSVHFLKSDREEGLVTQPAQQFQTSSGIIDMAQNKKTNNIAVVLHLFYEDLFKEIKKYLRNLGHFDLYISMPESNHHLEDRIFASFPGAKIFYTENRGRDIYPFISIYKNISLLNYECLLKIHTKKSPHREDGGIWRTDIYGKLMGSTEIVNSVLSAFENNQTVGIIGPKGHVIDYRIYWGSNKPKTEELAGRVGISVTEDHSFNFVAGSMFWAKPEALRYLSLLPIEYKEFEPEPVGPDGALVHALERFIGLTVEETGYSIYESDDQGNISDPRKDYPSDSYPFGEPNDTYLAGPRKIARLQNSDRNIIHRLASLIRKARLAGSLIFIRRAKIIRILIEAIKNPRDPRIGTKLSQSIRALKEKLYPLDYGPEKINDKGSPVIREEIELTEQLAEKLLKYLSNEEYVISISQSDYTQLVGGVEIVIMDEQKAYNKNGLVYLHIFPFLMPHLRLISEDEPLYIGVNCNGERLGITDREGLLFSLKQLNGKKLSNIIIHHTMGFDIAFINRILDEVGGKTGQFWLHDNFSLCPGYTLLRNDLVYCGAPDINSNACLICKYGDRRRIQQPAFRKLFEANDLEVLAPSRFTLDLWEEKFPFPTKPGRVVPHLNLNWDGMEPVKQPNMPLRIGYLGYPVFWKGWDTWLRLVKKFSNDPRYQFYCFTSWPKSSEKMKWINVSVTKDDRLSMVTALKDNKIDVAFLWSLCPETFSFTLYESLAAGCYVLTYKDSGNIQAYLNQNTDRGLVLKNEQALFELFSGDDVSSLVTDYQKNGRPQGDFSFLSGFD